MNAGDITVIVVVVLLLIYLGVTCRWDRQRIAEAYSAAFRGNDR